MSEGGVGRGCGKVRGGELLTRLDLGLHSREAMPARSYMYVRARTLQNVEIATDRPGGFRQIDFISTSAPHPTTDLTSLVAAYQMSTVASSARFFLILSLLSIVEGFDSHLRPFVGSRRSKVISNMSAATGAFVLVHYS